MKTCSTCGKKGDCDGTIAKCVNCWEVEKRVVGYAKSVNGLELLRKVVVRETYEQHQQKIISAKCQGCAKEVVGKAEDLFNAGWDVPPYFTVIITCPNCPSAPILIEMTRK